MQTLFKAKNKYTDGLYLFTKEDWKITWLCDYCIDSIPSYEELLKKEAAEILKDATPMYYDDNIGALKEAFDPYIDENNLDMDNVQEGFESFATDFVEKYLDEIEELGEIDCKE